MNKKVAQDWFLFWKSSKLTENQGSIVIKLFGINLLTIFGKLDHFINVIIIFLYLKKSEYIYTKKVL